MQLGNSYLSLSTRIVVFHVIVWALPSFAAMPGIIGESSSNQDIGGFSAGGTCHLKRPNESDEYGYTVNDFAIDNSSATLKLAIRKCSPEEVEKWTEWASSVTVVDSKDIPSSCQSRELPGGIMSLRTTKCGVLSAQGFSDSVALIEHDIEGVQSSVGPILTFIELDKNGAAAKTLSRLVSSGVDDLFSVIYICNSQQAQPEIVVDESGKTSFDFCVFDFNEQFLNPRVRRIEGGQGE